MHLASSRCLYKLTGKPKRVNIPTIFSGIPPSQIWIKPDAHQRREPDKTRLISDLKPNYSCLMLQNTNSFCPKCATTLLRDYIEHTHHQYHIKKRRKVKQNKSCICKKKKGKKSCFVSTKEPSGDLWTLLTLWILARRAASCLQRILRPSVFVTEAPSFGDLVGTHLHSVLSARGLSFPFCKGGFGRTGEHLVLQAGLATADSKRPHRKRHPMAPRGTASLSIVILLPCGLMRKSA